MTGDAELWAAVVAAEAEVTRRRADFYQHAADRPRVLDAALGTRGWHQRAAFSFLQSLPDDVPAVMDALVGRVFSHRTFGDAVRTIAASPRRDAVLAEIRRILAARPPETDAEDLRDLASLLVALKAWDDLRALLGSVAGRPDPALREVVDDLRESLPEA